MATSRTRTRVYKLEGIVYRKPNFKGSQRCHTSQAYTSSYGRTMTDIIGNSTSMKPCSSTDTVGSAGTIAGTYWYNSDRPGVSSYVCSSEVDEIRIEGALGPLPASPNFGVYSLTTSERYQARCDVYSDFRPSANLLATVAECASIKGLYTQVAQRIPKMTCEVVKRLSKSQRRHFVKKAKERGLKGANGFIKQFASDYLAFSFGVLPLVSDVKALWNASVRLGAGVLYPEIQTYHGMKTFRRKETTSTTTYGSSTNATRLYFSSCTQKDVGTIRCSETSRVQWETSHINSFAGRWDTFTNQLGLHSLFGALWEVVPFSFVADWVLPTKQLVDYLDESRAYRPAFTLLASCSSTKVEQYSRWSNFVMGRGAFNPFRYTVNQTISDPWAKSITYNRTVPSSIPSWGLDTVSGINGKRISYLAALVVQRT